MDNVLKTEIKTFLDKTGFTQYQQETEKIKNKINNMLSSYKMSIADLKNHTKSFFALHKTEIDKVKGFSKDMFNFKGAFQNIASNPIAQLVGGYFTLTGAVSQYNKMVEASNKQFALESQLDTVLKTQGYYDSQIQGLKDYMGQLQEAGVIGDEASMVAIKKMAGFKLQEETIRKLLPQVHNLMVSEKGLASTEADAEKWSNALGLSITSGQTRALKQAGIVFDEHKQKLFENANEQQRASMLYKELTERIGDQNAEILKTPEGKIVNAQNRIGDVYERFGGILRETRGKFWQFMADNLDTIAPFTEKVIKALTGGFDTGINTVQFLFKTFSNMPNGAKNAIKLLTGFFLIKKFPLAGGILILEDIFGAFQGKDSLIEKVFNKMTEFFNSDYKFADLRKSLQDFWHDMFTDDKPIEKISGLTLALEVLVNTVKGSIGWLQMIWGFTGGALIGAWKLMSGDLEGAKASSWGNIKGGAMKVKGAFTDNHDALIRAGVYDENGLFSKRGQEQVVITETQKNVNKMPKDIKENLTNNDYRKSYYKENKDTLKSFGNQRADTIYYPKEQPKKELSQESREIMQKMTTNNNVNINNNPTYNINIEHTGDNFADFENKFKNMMNNHNENELRKFKVQYGSYGMSK
ncbi:MAG: hypothetical protein SOY60_06965 [Fusobacterium gastrosuis]|uniref:hypothetical protein n=1 Tax=Fusobacterium gastrosuis TaxID=1755100 RepID=UPI002A8BA3DA|nr:hypothetical protein [Fusobacterium gastrosuis]